MVVDDDHFDPTRNPYRNPAATVHTNGLKAEWLARLFRDAGWASDHGHRDSSVREGYPLDGGDRRL